ncbi:hypothetical protein CIW54_18685 [Paraburkholderia sp. T12-10]|nr:hypothetical protein CIW54_18685 [Paraburkholderia sp. T12-10]
MNGGGSERRLPREFRRKESIEGVFVERVLLQKTANRPILAPIGPLAAIVERDETGIELLPRRLGIENMANLDATRGR